MVRIVAAGHLNWDVTLRVASLPEPDGEARITSQTRSGGGSAANVAAALAGFDLPAGLIASVGDDDHGLLARRELEQAGVDLAGLETVPGGATTVKYLIVDDVGEVMVLANEGVNEHIEPDDIDADYVREAAHLHLTGQRPDTARRLADIATHAGNTVSFDPGRRLAEREYGSLLDEVDVLFLNDREAVEALAEARAAPEELVSGTDRVIVVKHGAEGATVYAPDGTYEHPGFGVDQVDTTGAGDAFAAGFLAVTVGGLDLEPSGVATGDHERALEVANACGALAACDEGARTAPSRAELAAFLDEQYRSRA
jgi:ribokinase